MKAYETRNIRNLALVGHAGSGKTTFAESLLFAGGEINRQGSVEEKNTVSDNKQIERERMHSVSATTLFVQFNNNKINIIDAPGYSDYIGETVAAIKPVETAAILVNAHSGLEIGVENAFEYAKKMNKAIAFVINKLDMENASFEKSVEELKANFGASCSVAQYPLSEGPGANSIVDIIDMALYEFDSKGKYAKKDIPESEKSKAEDYRNELIESIAETDEDLMNKYFDAGDLSPDEIKEGLKKAMVERQIFPVFCAIGKSAIGSLRFLEIVSDYFPTPLDAPAWETEDGKEIKIDPEKPVSLFVYKLLSEQHLGDMTFFKVVTGKLTPSMDLLNERKNATERLNQLFAVNGKKREDVEFLMAGDIGSTVKLKSTKINDTLREKSFAANYKPIEFPKPIVRTAIAPKAKGEEEKVGTGMNAICLEDPTLKFEHSQELRQMILYGQGELHLTAAKWKLENRFKVEAEFVQPKVPYRETIQKQAKGSYRHKKQTGGAGQFAEVHMMIEPYRENAPDPEGLSVRGKDLYELDWGGKLEFINCIVGGAIDQRFMPAILKGVMEKMQEGPLTGSYVRDIRVVIYDGKMHPVDSNEAAFKTAGMMVFKNNFVEAAPKLLEPIYDVVIKAPKDFVGDIMSDLPSRRGVILGMDTEGNYQKIKAKMPLAELDKYSSALRSMTQAKASYTAEFSEYQTVPPNVQEELIEAYKKRQEEAS